MIALVPWAVLAAAVPPDAVPWYAPAGIKASLEADVGAGTFISNGKTDNPYWASTLTIEPSWTFRKGLALELHLAAYEDWTRFLAPCRPASGPRPTGAPLRDCSDADDPTGTVGARGGFEDLGILLAAEHLFGWEEPAISSELSVALPLSKASQAAKNLFTAGLHAAIAQPIGPITPSLGFGFSKFFPLQKSPFGDTALPGDGPPIATCPANRRADCVLRHGSVASWHAQVELDLEAEIAALDGLTATIHFAYRYTRSLSAGGDSLSSTRRDSAGRPVVDGVNDADTTEGGIELSYPLDDSFKLALGVSSLQPARTADGRSIRFPFFDFISPANNYTAWYLQLGYQL